MTDEFMYLAGRISYPCISGHSTKKGSSPHVRGADFITHCSHRPSLLTQQEEAVSVLWVDYDRTY